MRRLRNVRRKGGKEAKKERRREDRIREHVFNSKRGTEEVMIIVHHGTLTLMRIFVLEDIQVIEEA